MISELMCLSCGSYFPIPRPLHQLREENHIKTIWCPHCKEETQHVEKLKDRIDLRNPRSALDKEEFIDEDTDWESLFGLK